MLYLLQLEFVTKDGQEIYKFGEVWKGAKPKSSSQPKSLITSADRKTLGSRSGLGDDEMEIGEALWLGFIDPNVAVVVRCWSGFGSHFLISYGGDGGVC
ncbi:hypothetical protein L1887_23535 [Cichorium endivia]|nr:hypothetical protein L1887_23535 [Cichorium endivia]